MKARKLRTEHTTKPKGALLHVTESFIPIQARNKIDKKSSKQLAMFVLLSLETRVGES